MQGNEEIVCVSLDSQQVASNKCIDAPSEKKCGIGKYGIVPAQHGIVPTLQHFAKEFPDTAVKSTS